MVLKTAAQCYHYALSQLLTRSIADWSTHALQRRRVKWESIFYIVHPSSRPSRHRNCQNQFGNLQGHFISTSTSKATVIKSVCISMYPFLYLLAQIVDPVPPKRLQPVR